MLMDATDNARPALAGQVALITGGGRGQGRVIAEDLAASGAAVAVLGRSEQHLAATVSSIEHAGGQALAVPVNVTDQHALEWSIEQVERRLGPITLMVNNAGIVSPLGPLWETDADEWWQTLDVNLRGTMLGMRVVLPWMIQRRAGRIVNLASRAATVAVAYGSAYVVSKTALVRLSENIALEVREYGIRVFAVDPGNVRTDMTEYLMYSAAGQRWCPWFRDIFDKGQNDAPDQIAQLVRRIARGQVDTLSGCFLSVADDLESMVTQAANNPQEGFHTLRIRA
jgi:NAD(P)-dependent dehydrogenase (short-subunit alcohol dehydrogenase family)